MSASKRLGPRLPCAKASPTLRTKELELECLVGRVLLQGNDPMGEVLPSFRLTASISAAFRSQRCTLFITHHSAEVLHSKTSHALRGG